MRQFAQSILLFTVVCAVVYGSAILVFGHITLPSTIQLNIPKPSIISLTFKDLQQTRDIDIAFLGSSHCYRGFDTRIFEAKGFRVFNLGTSSQTPRMSKMILKEYLKQLSPRYLVFEVCPLIFSSEVNIVESYLDVMVNEKRKDYLIKNNFVWDDIRVYNYIFHYSLSRLLNLDTLPFESRRYYTDNYIGKGYVERDLVSYKESGVKARNWDRHSAEFEAFRDILKIAGNAGVEVILVNAPVSSSFYKSYRYNSSFDSLMRNHGRYYNFNEIMGLQDSIYFYDEHHMNRKGVSNFNRKFLEVVKFQKFE